MNTIEGTRLWTLSEGGHYQGVDTIERTRLRTLSEGRETGGGDRSCRGTGGGDRSCRETGGGDRSNPIVGTVARLAAVIAAIRLRVGHSQKVGALARDWRR